MSVTLDHRFMDSFVSQEDIDALKPAVEKAHQQLESKSGAGSDFTGWLDLPSRIENGFIEELKSLGEEVRENSECVVSIGIGGSYLGIRAALDFLGDQKIPVYYAGQNMSADYMHRLLQSLRDRRVTLVVISKSGTTTEPAIAFRILKKFLTERLGEQQLKDRIICVTDQKKGALRQIADKNGYRSYVIPDDVGGRFSIFTPVGLVPLAISGIDVQGFVDGARHGQELYSKMNIDENLAYRYAAIRNLLYRQGKHIEVLASFYDSVFYVAEWWKQLFGESEGKDGKGIFPASLIYSTDLHSMGQLLQDGMRNLFETFLVIDQQKHKMEIPKELEDLDSFNVIAKQDLDFVNQKAYQATAEAHFEGGVPNMSFHICKRDAFHLGQLLYLFERAIAMSGHLLEVNPFDQPGVEAYKKKMFALLGK